MQIKFFFRLPFLYDDYWDENDNSNKQDIIFTRIIGLIHNISCNILWWCNIKLQNIGKFEAKQELKKNMRERI